MARAPGAGSRVARLAAARLQAARSQQQPPERHQSPGVDAFFAASRDGEFDALLAVLDPDVELRIDGGVLRHEASLVARGGKAVAAHTATYSKLYPYVRPALVDGVAGAVVVVRGRPFSVMAFTVSSGKIAAIDALIDPDRLAQLDVAIPG